MTRAVKLFSAFFLVAILGGVFAIGIYQLFEMEEKEVIREVALQPVNHLISNTKTTSPVLNFEHVAEMSVNSVVHVKTESVRNTSSNPFYNYFYGRPYQREQAIRSAGSGVIISDDGYIVTNNHVIDKAQKIQVTLNNKKTYDAEIIGNDPYTDLALLKIDANDLAYMPYGNSNNLHIGEWVLAVGNPFNLTSTVTAGIVSAKGRDINILQNNPHTGVAAIESFIQTDAAVNPGNSGGALVNTSGQLVGINAAIQSNTGSYSGYSFAIPVNIVKKVVKDLKEFGNVQRAFIGVSIRDINEDLAKQIDVDDLSGIYINSVTKEGSAYKAGILAGDIIKKIGSKSVNDVPELQEQLSQFRPGDKVDITIRRGKKSLLIPLTLKNLDGSETIIPAKNNSVLKILGAKVAPVKSYELENLRIREGIKIEEVYAGKLRGVGVKKGFVITKVNHIGVSSVQEFVKILNASKSGILLEGVYENGRRDFYGFGL